MGMCVVGFVAKVYIDRWREDLYVHQVGGVLFIEFVSEVGMFGFRHGMLRIDSWSFVRNEIP